MCYVLILLENICYNFGMNGNCHFMFSATVTGMVVLNLEKVNMILPNVPIDSEMGALLIMGGLIGGVFPDIDNPKSHFGQLCKPISSVIGEIGKLFGKTGSHHRGIFHDFSVYLAGLILSYFFAPFLVGFFLGALSHLFLDMFNPAGIPVLFGVRQIHLGRISADSTGAVVLTYMFISLFLATGIILKFAL